jgi:hypothetical protein
MLATPGSNRQILGGSNYFVLDAEWARQYLRPCSAALSHWLLPSTDSQRHTSHAQRKPPAKLLYHSWRCFGRDDTPLRFRTGNAAITFVLIFMEDRMQCQRLRENPFCLAVFSCEQRHVCFRRYSPCDLARGYTLFRFQSGSTSSPSMHLLMFANARRGQCMWPSK